MQTQSKRGDPPRTDAAYLLRGLSFPEVETNQEADIAQRSLAIQIVAAQVSFFASCMIKNEKDVSLLEGQQNLPPLVSVIGCGMVGCQILNTLLSIGWPPSCLGACSRNEDHFAQFSSIGVQCKTKASNFCEYEKDGPNNRPRILVIAVPYAQLRALTSTIAAQTSQSKTVIISIVAGTTYQKLHQLLPNFPHIIRTAVQLSHLSQQGRIKKQTLEEFVDDFSLQQAATHLASEEIEYIVSVFEELFICLGEPKKQAHESSLTQVLGIGTSNRNPSIQKPSGSLSLEVPSNKFTNELVSARFHETFAHLIDLQSFNGV